jgi:CRP-like cAMP-binding protein
MSESAFGRWYADGEIIARQGEVGDCLYVVQEGTVEIVLEDGETEVILRAVGRHEVIGEMAIIEHRPRSATIRARGPARLLTLDKRNFLRRINEDPSLALQMIETMAHRVRDLSDEVLELREALERRGVAHSGSRSP